MIRKPIAALLALVPAAALAQGGALDRAREAQKVSDEGNARVERAVDAQVAQEGDAAPPQAAPGQAAPAQAPAAAPGRAPKAPAKAAPAEGTIGVAPLEGGATAADEGRGTVPPPDTYTVRPGDTLWDLSGRFLNNPWYWPKIWSYNPEITNPHWITPGNVLRFYPSAEEAPARVEPVVAGAEPVPPGAAEEAEEPEVAPVRELEDLSRANMKAPESAEEKEAVAVAGPNKIGWVAPKQMFTRHDTFVTPRELEESGAIRAAFEEKIMLATHDRAYAKFRSAADVKMGETYTIYKTERPIYRPESDELLGYQSVILGAGRVVAVDQNAATVIITVANDPIERGAMLGPWTEKFFRPMVRKPNGRTLEGLIVAAQVDVVTQFGENHVVFVDRGTADGVQDGNSFQVVRSGDLYGKPTAVAPWDPSLPKEDVGDLLVIDAKEHVSTAIVMKSLRELVIGDRVEMRAAAGAGAGAGGD